MLSDSRKYIETKLSEVIAKAGGLTSDADKSGIQVIDPNGAGLEEKSGFFFWSHSRILPGTKIVVPKLRN